MNIEFYTLVGRLKDLPRKGWVERGIPTPETVAEHIYRTQFIAYDLAKAMGEDPEQCAIMMMIHDLPEALAGDISPSDGLSKNEKYARELQAAHYLAEISGNPEFVSFFTEYSEWKTPRARICKDADALECLMQVISYGQLYPDKRPSLEEFWPWANQKITTAAGRKIYQDLEDEWKRLVLSYKADKCDLQM